jgi:hypothetical protein
MKSDYNGLVEQSEKNQSVDENFNTSHSYFLTYVLVPYVVMELIRDDLECK